MFRFVLSDLISHLFNLLSQLNVEEVYIMAQVQLHPSCFSWDSDRLTKIRGKRDEGVSPVVSVCTLGSFNEND